MLPWSFDSMADALDCSAGEKIGHSGRDDGTRKTEEHRLEPAVADWLVGGF